MICEIKPGQNPSAEYGYEQHLLTMVNYINKNEARLLAALLAKFPEGVDWRISSRELPDTPLLHLAIFMGHRDIVDVLLAAGADPELKNARGYTSLVWAAKMQAWAIVDRLLQAGVNPATTTNENYTALHFVLRRGRTELAARLISLGAPVNVNSDDKISPLFEAIRSRLAGPVKLVLSHGASVTSGGGAFGHLSEAINTRKREIVLQLIKAGIDPDGDYFAPGYKTASLTSLIRKAPCGGDPYTYYYRQQEYQIREITQLLLNSGADPNLPRFDDLTPVGAAILTGRTKIISLLAEHGATRTSIDSLERHGGSFCNSRKVALRATAVAMIRSLDPVIPLQVLCRLCIRKTVVSCRREGESLISNVPKLPLSPLLKRYLCNINDAGL